MQEWEAKWEVGEERAGSSNPKVWWQIVEIEKKIATMHDTLDRNCTKMGEPLRKGQELGEKGMRRGKFRASLFPPHSLSLPVMLCLPTKSVVNL